MSRIRGLYEFEAKMKLTRARAEAANRRALVSAGWEVVKKAWPMTPYKSGYLRSSFMVSKHRQYGFGNMVYIYVNAPYGLYVHEMPTWYNFTTEGTGPKYLEKALLASSSRVREIIALSFKVIEDSDVKGRLPDVVLLPGAV